MTLAADRHDARLTAVTRNMPTKAQMAHVRVSEHTILLSYIGPQECVKGVATMIQYHICTTQLSGCITMIRLLFIQIIESIDILCNVINQIKHKLLYYK